MYKKLEEFTSGEDRIVVSRNAINGNIKYTQNGYNMSEADSTGYPIAGYPHTVYAHIHTCNPILMLGCAGGTIANMFKDNRDITIVDINPISFTIAKKYFKLNPKIVCHAVDAYQYVFTTKKKFEAIVMDCFDGEGRIPEQLLTKLFILRLNYLLTEKGKLIINHCYRNTETIKQRLAEISYHYTNTSHCYIAQKP